MNHTDCLSDAQNELHTISDYIRFAMGLFNESDLYYGHGTASALDDSVALVLGALKLSPDLDAVYFSSRLLMSERKMLLAAIFKRLKTHEPVAYLIQKSYFCGLPFYIDQRVLIPRSPIGELIEEAFSPWIERDRISRILDLGTGSGCIAIACALLIPEASVDAIDIDLAALEVAKKNCLDFDLTETLRLIPSDLFSALSNTDRYDVIISNPPYVPSSSMLTLPKEYHHEPQAALDGGQDGLMIVDRILKEASQYLSEQGILIVEVGEAQIYLTEKYPLVPFTWLQFSNGGDGVFLLTKQELDEYQSLFQTSS